METFRDPKKLSCFLLTNPCSWIVLVTSPKIGEMLCLRTCYHGLPKNDFFKGHIVMTKFEWDLVVTCFAPPITKCFLAMS